MFCSQIAQSLLSHKVPLHRINSFRPSVKCVRLKRLNPGDFCRSLVIFMVSKYQIKRVGGRSFCTTPLCFVNVSYKQKFRRNVVTV